MLVMVCGAVIAGSNDMSFDPLGYLLVTINNFATGLNLVLVKQLCSSPLGNVGSLFYNSLLSIPVVLLVVLVRGEGATIMGHPSIYESRFQLLVISSTVLGMALNFSIYLNTQVNSALTQSVCGQMRAVISTVVGLFTFNVLVTPGLCVGLSFTACAGMMYALSKLHEQQNKGYVELHTVSYKEESSKT